MASGFIAAATAARLIEFSLPLHKLHMQACAAAGCLCSLTATHKRTLADLLLLLLVEATMQFRLEKQSSRVSESVSCAVGLRFTRLARIDSPAAAAAAIVLLLLSVESRFLLESNLRSDCVCVSALCVCVMLVLVLHFDLHFAV